MKSLIKIIPKPLKNFLKNVYYSMEDMVEVISLRRNKLTPSRSKIRFIGGGDFKEIGEEFFGHFVKLGELKPSDKVFDIGCGVGRMAVPLTTYLKNNGSYEGIDVFPDGVNWCIKNITLQYPNFHFQLADIYNKRYRPKGKTTASEYKFPFPDNYFDFVFLTSVFTHLMPDDMENYLSEIARVLKKEGRCLATFYLLNPEAEKHIVEKQNTIDFNYDFGIYRLQDTNVPEDAIAFKEDFVRDLYKKYQLNIAEPIHYGKWCGRSYFLSYQDIIVSTKN